MWGKIPDNGIIIGPYGGIGYIQRDDLKHVAVTCVGLFRWLRNLWSKEQGTREVSLNDT